MDSIILAIVAVFAVGVLIGGITRSLWALVYPAIIIAWAVVTPAYSESSGEFTRADAQLIGVIGFGMPAFVGTLIGIGSRKAIESRG